LLDKIALVMELGILCSKIDVVALGAAVLMAFEITNLHI